MTRIFSFSAVAWLTTMNVVAANKDAFKPRSSLRRLDTEDFTLLGSTIVGAAGSSMPGHVEFGTSVMLSSNDGSRLAVGSLRHDWATPNADSNLMNEDGGAVFLYDYDGSDWNLIWFLAGNPQERIGDRLSLSADGSRIAVRRYNPNGAEIYDISPGESPTLVTTISSDHDGSTVTLSPDGTHLALSSESYNDFTGRVEIYREGQEGNIPWDCIGVIDGYSRQDSKQDNQENNQLSKRQDRFGWMTAFSSTGDRLAISAPNNDDDHNNGGLVVVYDYDSVSSRWLPVGQEILGDEHDARFGFSMDISGDGSTLVVGSPNSDMNGSNSGRISMHELLGGMWVPKGNVNVIPGEEDDRFGRSVSISYDGNRVASSSYFHEGHNGVVRVAEFVENDWIPVGSIEGDTDNRLGFGLLSVSMSSEGVILATGSVRAEHMGNSTGQVSVFEAPPRPTAAPSATPSLTPSVSPSLEPSSSPSESPSSEPSVSPSDAPSTEPSLSPSSSPSNGPTAAASMSPTASAQPSLRPSAQPSPRPSAQPSESPSALPSESPSATPTDINHTGSPSAEPSMSPSSQPTDTVTMPPFGAGGVNKPIDNSSASKCLLAAKAIAAIVLVMFV